MRLSFSETCSFRNERPWCHPKTAAFPSVGDFKLSTGWLVVIPPPDSDVILLMSLDWTVTFCDSSVVWDGSILCPVSCVTSIDDEERTGLLRFPNFGRLLKHSGHFHAFLRSIKLNNLKLTFVHSWSYVPLHVSHRRCSLFGTVLLQPIHFCGASFVAVVAWPDGIPCVFCD